MFWLKMSWRSTFITPKRDIISIAHLQCPAVPYVLMVCKLNSFESCRYKANSNLFLYWDETLSPWINFVSKVVPLYDITYGQINKNTIAFCIVTQIVHGKNEPTVLYISVLKQVFMRNKVQYICFIPIFH